jgi:hypothetical protein
MARQNPEGPTRPYGARQAKAWLDDQRNDPDYAEDIRTRLGGMNQTEQIDYLLQKSHFRSDKKVVNYVNKTLQDFGYPMILADKILERNKWHRRKNNYRYFATRHYEYPIYANHFHSFQIDIIDQSKEYNLPTLKPPEDLNKHDRKAYRKRMLQEQEEAYPPRLIQTEPPEKRDDGRDGRDGRDKPPYIYVFQNVNTKYVRAVAMWHKTETSGLKALQLLWKDTRHHVMSLVSDQEKAINNELVTAWLAEKKISLKLVRSDRHSALGVINRLIRTLRDMNTPEEKSEHQSTHKKYRDFTIYRIAKLIHIYNHTKHDTTKRIPAEADIDQAWEERWIIKKLYQAEERKRLSDYELEKGDFVRYILPKQNETGTIVKRRYSLTPERFLVHGHKGHAYIIMAEDGSHLTVPRWRLKRCTEEELRQHPLAETIPESMRPETVMATGPVKARKVAASLRTVITPAGEQDAWVPDIQDRGADKVPEREIFHEKRAYAEEERQQNLSQDRDRWFAVNFLRDHVAGDGLIVPSEGRVWEAGNHNIHGHFDRVNGRLIIPILTTDRDRWILMVATFTERKPKVIFYAPQAKPKEDVNRDVPGIEEKIKKYLMGAPIEAEDFDYPQRGTYIIGLERPKREDARYTFLYIAYYALEYIFQGKKPPNDSKNKPSENIPAWDEDRKTFFETLKKSLM